ncbi:hypothetical protein [Croceicoccus gelatinilyticus]|uniref:hypothetical protein n=1 Tax=Croceicoccus gelatinilyticus TaxID=2835536 RepID=UPI001BCB9DE8|nr:hypothetical protein [Croceicoccus gelatinilyticus]MBS7671509.1 hypothetical protein [Croceicoccus gelatinilyticus]
MEALSAERYVEDGQHLLEHFCRGDGLRLRHAVDLVGDIDLVRADAMLGEDLGDLAVNIFPALKRRGFP